MIKEHFIDLGLSLAKAKLLDIKQQNDIRSRLADFIDIKLGENYNCSLEEELDFGGLIEYISNSFLDDIERRLFGNLTERRIAHQTIINKAVAYAHGKTSLSEKRATKLISDAMEILHDFYRKRINRDMLLVASEIEDAVSEEMSKQHDQQTQIILKEIDEVKSFISDAGSVISIDKGLALLNNGQVAFLEDQLTQFTNTMSSGHTLFPYYGYGLSATNGKIQCKSIPLSKDAIELYPPNVKCLGTIRMGDGYLSELSLGAIDYANRHQLPIIFDIKKAENYLGDVLDPVQHDAEELIGEEITLPPKPFSPAFPCSIKFDDEIVFDYILFRTKEILDDGTTIVSNYEQQNYPYKITMKMNPENKNVDFSFQKNGSICNEDSLTYAIVMKKAILQIKVTVKLLEKNEIFLEGMFNNFRYNGGFSSVDEEIDFFSRIVTMEKYFKKAIKVPNEIYQSDWKRIVYISDLLRGQTHYSKWSRFEFTLNVSAGLKKEIVNTEDKGFNLSYVGTAKLSLWNDIYELPIARTFEAGKIENLEKLKEKIRVLEIGDSVKASFVAIEDIGKMNDVFFDETKPIQRV